MTRKELATLIKEIEKSEKRLKDIQEDKAKILDIINENKECRYWLNAKFNSIFYPNELLVMYNYIEHELTKFLDVNKVVLDDILDKVVL